MTIFVSIAAYRDADLPHTIADCLAKARYPHDLRFGLCWQHAPGDPPPPDLPAKRMRRVDVPRQESGGACWARAQAMSLWSGEDYYCQIDSHHRFAEGWDLRLLKQIERSGETRPLLTTYALGFDPDAPLPKPSGPTDMAFARFTADGIPQYVSRVRSDWVNRDTPVRARFVSGHLIFTLGRFVEDVPYDPELYFIGEEIMLAVRAFTHGYALLHPSVHILWHEYSRRQRVMHWDDHGAIDGSRSSAALDAASLKKVGNFLRDPFLGRFGCGTARSFTEYERYAGVDFTRRRVTAAARRCSEPPVPPPPSVGVGRARDWQVRIAFDRDRLPGAAFDRPSFWYVGFHDAAGIEIARADANPSELRSVIGQDNQIVLDRSFRAERQPASWTVWPVDGRRQWLPAITGPIDSARATMAAS